MNDDPADGLFDRAPCGLLVTDAEDVIVRVNETFLEWMRCASSEVLGSPFPSLLLSGDQAFWATQVQDSLWSSSQALGVSLTMRRADGTPLPVLLNAHTISDERGVSGVRLAIFDATARQDFERGMLVAKRTAEASEAGVRILQDAVTRFLAAADERQVTAHLSSILRDAFAASEVAVVMYEEGGSTFRLVAGAHLRDVLDVVRASRTDDRRALSLDQVIAIHDIEDAYGRSPAVGDAMRAQRAASFLAVPIGDGDEAVGAFGVFFGRSRSFDEDELDLYRALARQAALAYSRVQLAERLRELATRDHLTGLANRAAIDDGISRTLRSARIDRRSAALIFIDLDGFKEINDTAGHRAGDVILQSVALRLLRGVRDGDAVGRFGGDEFVVVCTDADLDTAQRVARRLADAIAEPIGDWTVTASMGIAVFDPDGPDESVAAITRRADAAMYDSKREGRNRISVSPGI